MHWSLMPNPAKSSPVCASMTTRVALAACSTLALIAWLFGAPRRAAGVVIDNSTRATLPAIAGTKGTQRQSDCIRVEGRVLAQDKSIPLGGMFIRIVGVDYGAPAVEFDGFTLPGMPTFKTLKACQSDREGRFTVDIPNNYLERGRILALGYSDEYAAYLEWHIAVGSSLASGDLPTMELQAYRRSGQLKVKALSQAQDGEPQCGARVVAAPTWGDWGKLEVGSAWVSIELPGFLKDAGLVSTTDQAGVATFDALPVYPGIDPDGSVYRTSCFDAWHVSEQEYVELDGFGRGACNLIVETIETLTISGVVLSEDHQPLTEGVVSYGMCGKVPVRTDGTWTVECAELGEKPWYLRFKMLGHKERIVPVSARALISITREEIPVIVSD